MEKRHRGRQEHLDGARRAGLAMVGERHLWEEDVAAVVERARQLRDYVQGIDAAGDRCSAG